MNTIRILPLVVSLCLTSSVFPQGPLTPPGAPAPTMKTLDQIEPRTRIPGGTAPFSTTTSGSYYLSGNLSVASGDAITVTASNVTLDLGGFELVGNGANRGVVIGGGQTNVTIRNGTIRNFTTYGIDGAGNARVRVENVRVLNNGFTGIEIGDDGAVIDCLVEANGEAGIVAKDKCVIRNCQAIGNIGADAHGISVGHAAHISGCVAGSNDGNGINAGDDCVLDSCVTSLNSGHGMNLSSRCTIVNCTANGNGAPGIEGFDHLVITATTACFNNNIGIYIDGGTITNCTVNNNAFEGIHNFGHATLQVVHCDISYNGTGVFTDGAGRIEGCSITNNGTGGIKAESRVHILNNTCDSNGAGAGANGIEATGSDNRIEGNTVTNQINGLYVTGTGNLVIRNSASGNTANYNIVAGNSVGPTVTSANITTNNSPHANYDF